MRAGFTKWNDGARLRSPEGQVELTALARSTHPGLLVSTKLSRTMQSKMKGLVHQVFRAPSCAVALKRGRDLIAGFSDRYSAVMECLERDLEECVTRLRCPEAHHHRIRTTNRLERLNGEGRRRT